MKLVQQLQIKSKELLEISLVEELESVLVGTRSRIKFKEETSSVRGSQDEDVYVIFAREKTTQANQAIEVKSRVNKEEAEEGRKFQEFSWKRKQDQTCCHSNRSRSKRKRRRLRVRIEAQLGLLKTDPVKMLPTLVSVMLTLLATLVPATCYSLSLAESRTNPGLTKMSGKLTTVKHICC